MQVIMMKNAKNSRKITLKAQFFFIYNGIPLDIVLKQNNFNFPEFHKLCHNFHNFGNDIDINISEYPR